MIPLHEYKSHDSMLYASSNKQLCVAKSIIIKATKCPRALSSAIQITRISKKLYRVYGIADIKGHTATD